MIVIPRSIFKKIVDYSNSELPIEACGYLAGTGLIVKQFYPVRNADNSDEHFSFDPEEQFAVLDKSNQEGLELIAVFHSHPSTPARMSKEDIKLAQDPDIFYVIYSVKEGELRAFKVGEDKGITETVIEYPDNKT